MKALHLFTDKAYQREYRQHEIASGVGRAVERFRSKHDVYGNEPLHIRARMISNSYYLRHPGVHRLCADLEARLVKTFTSEPLADKSLSDYSEFPRTLHATSCGAGMRPSDRGHP